MLITCTGAAAAGAAGFEARLCCASAGYRGVGEGAPCRPSAVPVLPVRGVPLMDVPWRFLAPASPCPRHREVSLHLIRIFLPVARDAPFVVRRCGEELAALPCALQTAGRASLVSPLLPPSPPSPGPRSCPGPAVPQRARGRAAARDCGGRAALGVCQAVALIAQRVAFSDTV